MTDTIRLFYNQIAGMLENMKQNGMGKIKGVNEVTGIYYDFDDKQYTIKVEESAKTTKEEG